MKFLFLRKKKKNKQLEAKPKYKSFYNDKIRKLGKPVH